MKKYKKAFFIGIGGSGMSALAKLMSDFGITVIGSDRNENEMTKILAEKGIEVIIGQDAKNITEDIDCVIYTLAVQDDNPEIQKAKEKNISMFTYAEMLGEFSKDNFTVAVSGTHGKTTTTAMVGDVFKGMDRNPYLIVGSILKRYNSNYIQGDENTFVVEACEYKKSFINLTPNILIITNIDLDHLDFYKDLKDVQDAFEELIRKMPDDGIIICESKDKKIIPVIKDKKQRIIDYSDFRQYVPENIFGEHNISNAAAAMALSAALDFSVERSKEALSHFEGTWRRFQCIGKTDKGALVYDDYAHHPTAISVTIVTLLNRFADKKIIIVFQPHTYSRTHSLFKDFVASLQGVFEVIVLPIYAAREENTFEVHSEQLVEEISLNQKVKFLPDFDSVVSYLEDKKTSDYLIMTMGAGDVYKITDMLI